MKKFCIISIVILVFILGLIFTSIVKAKEKPRLDMLIQEVVTTTYCAATENVNKTFEPKQSIFQGILDEVNVLNIYLNKEDAFTVIVHSASGISCIYFAGGMGMIIEKQKGINY